MRWPFRNRRAPSVPLVLYTRAGCGLCEELKETLRRARLSRRWTLREVDVDEDPQLRETYGLALPVLWVDGTLACKGPVPSVDELARKFERIVSRGPSGGEPEHRLPPRDSARGSGSPQGQEAPEETRDGGHR